MATLLIIVSFKSGKCLIGAGKVRYLTAKIGETRGRIGQNDNHVRTSAFRVIDESSLASVLFAGCMLRSEKCLGCVDALSHKDLAFQRFNLLPYIGC